MSAPHSSRKWRDNRDRGFTTATHRIIARQLPLVPAPPVHTEREILEAYANDAAHLGTGVAGGVAFPRSTAEVAALVASASEVLAVGAQSSLTGGATPRGHLVISTRHLDHIEVQGERVRAGAGVELSQLQAALAPHGRWYPPVPTFDGATVGGTIATNAAGAATFKYGSTRPWVEAITVVLADGSVLDVRRGEVTASDKNVFEVALPSGTTVRVPVPAYTMPKVAKLSAGYFARPGMDLIDLFIGSEGTLGIVTEATLRTLPKPQRCCALVTCSGDAQAVAVAGLLRDEAQQCWRGEAALDVAAIEYMGDTALAVVPDEVWRRTGIARTAPGQALLLVQIEMSGDYDAALTRFVEVMEEGGVTTDPQVATPGDDRTAARFFELREAVPAAVNALVGAARAAIGPMIHKVAGDFVVPFERLADSIALYRETCERHGLRYAIWGHASDGNLHPNIIPASATDVEKGCTALFEMAAGVKAMGGATLAEHGVGRHVIKRRLLQELYGEAGIEQMRAVKRALDPDFKLAAGVLFTVTPAPHE